MKAEPPGPRLCECFMKSYLLWVSPGWVMLPTSAAEGREGSKKNNNNLVVIVLNKVNFSVSGQIQNYRNQSLWKCKMQYVGSSVLFSSFLKNCHFSDQKEKSLFSDLLELPMKKGQLILLANVVETWHGVLGVALKMQEGILLSEENGGGGGCVVSAPGQQIKNYLFMESGLGVSRILGKQRPKDEMLKTSRWISPALMIYERAFEFGFHCQWFFKLLFVYLR